MNRRVPVKKNYFAFLSGLASSKALRLMAYFAVLVLGILLFATPKVDAAAVVAGLALLLIPIAVIAAILYGFKKITGLSVLQAVDWVGEKTLLLLNLLIAKLQKLGSTKVEAKQEAARTQALVEPELKTDTHKLEPKLEPSFGFSEGEDDDEALDLLTKVEPTLETSEDENLIILESSEAVEIELTDHIATPISAIADPILFKNPDDLIEDEVEEPPFEGAPIFDADVTYDSKAMLNADDTDDDVDIIELINVQHEEEHIVSEITEPSKTALKNIVESTITASPKQVLSESVEDSSLPPFLYKRTEGASDDRSIESESTIETVTEKMSDDIPELVEAEADIEEDLSAEDLEVDELELEIKSFFQEEAPEKLSVSAELEEPPKNYLDFNRLRKEHEETVENNAIAGEAGFISQQDSENSEAENNALYSMLSQAEEKASDMLSSFSEKLSHSLGFDLEAKQEGETLQAHEPKEYSLPSIDLLQVHQHTTQAYTAEQLEQMSRSVERVLKDYKVDSEVVGAYPGPIITRFELLLAPGVKVSRVSGLAKDLARAMLVTSVRVVEIIEGTPYIGLEIPNKYRELVAFREILDSEQFQQAESPITLALGKDVSGDTVVYDLAKMPHLLVAGTTGSGKSVAINTMILSMLYKATPEQVRMIMIDPKMLELSVYEGIPHLLTPVVTDMKEAQSALRWAVAEMERRYKLMAKVGVRGLEGFNQKINEAAERGETIRDPLHQQVVALEEGESFPVLSTLPSIVIVIDELADMMMIVGKKVEELIARLAQKARAAGIHLILATQRPSVDVLTGLIKANVPTRISFQVSSRIDSRTILDQGGAEALLGNGDMLFLPSGRSVPTRAHGAFVADDEVHAIVGYLKTQGRTHYLTEITQEELADHSANSGHQETVDELYPEAVNFVLETGKASISSVQRRFKVGYNRAARMIDQMEEERIVSEPEGNGSRRVLNKDEQ